MIVIVFFFVVTPMRLKNIFVNESPEEKLNLSYNLAANTLITFFGVTLQYVCPFPTVSGKWQVHTFADKCLITTFAQLENYTNNR